MDIKGKVFCFFEQSGTFKKEFHKLGYAAEDYDIQNDFGETDHIIDLFAEIEKGYKGMSCIFDSITKDDLIMAFFPCIYFCAPSQMLFSYTHRNYKNLNIVQKTDKILERSRNREKFYTLLIKMFTIVISRGLRMIVENPWSEQTYLKANFVMRPTIIDTNRMRRGDYFVKPTAYWFVSCTPTDGDTYQNDKEKRRITSVPPPKKKAKRCLL